MINVLPGKAVLLAYLILAVRIPLPEATSGDYQSRASYESTPAAKIFSSTTFDLIYISFDQAIKIYPLHMPDAMFHNFVNPSTAQNDCHFSFGAKIVVFLRTR